MRVAGMASKEDELERVAKQRIRTGELPCHPTARMWGSHGTGALCSLCDRPIRPEEVEYEVALAADGDSGRGEHVLRFHLACHAIWQAECVREGGAPAEAT